MHGHTVEDAKTPDQVKLIGLTPCCYLRIKRFRGIREIFKESRTQPAFHVEIRRIIPVSTAFLTLPIEAVLMPGKRCAGKDQSEPTLGTRDIGHHTINPSIGAGNKRLLRQSNPRVVEYPLAVVLIWRNNVDRIHLEFLRPMVCRPDGLLGVATKIRFPLFVERAHAFL
jgi:hypothetical protein